jgi:hypothetical protein
MHVHQKWMGTKNNVMLEKSDSAVCRNKKAIKNRPLVRFANYGMARKKPTATMQTSLPLMHLFMSVKTENVHRSFSVWFIWVGHMVTLSCRHEKIISVGS